jgi:hypothetical protein
MFVIYIYIKLTERCGRVVNTPAYYSEGPGLKSWPEDRLSWQVFVVILSPSMQIPS